MNNKTCKTCIENDNGLCDRKGILIEEDDTCEKHTENWKETMMENLSENQCGKGRNVLTRREGG